MIVIDASALTKYVLHESGWDEISTYLRTKRPLYSLDHVLKECCNAVWKHYYVRKLISRTIALELVKRIKKLVDTQVVILEPENQYLERAVEIALDNGLTVYDSLYLAQAEKYGEILTSDERQARVAKSLGIITHYIP